jgi:nicotinamidase-related amidase
MSETSIDRSTTALVVIDLQKGVLSMPAEPHTGQEVVGNAARLARTFRKHQMPVFLVHVTPSADMKDRLSPVADSETWRGSPATADWSEIIPELEPQRGDFIITKRQWGAFYGTELDLQLRRRRIDTIVLCGISTAYGVESTARFAYEYGYQQIFVEDAMSARTREEHDHAVRVIFPRIGRVRKTEEVLKALGTTDA